MSSEDLYGHAQDLVSQAGGSQIQTVDRVFGGRNNQVFKVSDSSGQVFALKAYFRHPDDPRDRLGAEWSFSEYAWKEGIRCIAQPLVADTRNGLGLYGWVEGSVPRAGEVDEDAVSQVLSFLESLNHGRESELAERLPMASEACLTMGAHLDTVGRRLAILMDAVGADSLGQEALNLLQEVNKVWQGVKAYAQDGEGLSVGFANEISRTQQCISPSDLGFHNALINDDGQIVFLDFEYAGWDDPAKLVCDFFHQEKVPIARTHYEAFRDRVIVSHSDGAIEAATQRVDRLMPVYSIKWLIMRLNEFRPEGAQRRAFAEPLDHPEERKFKQLEKARQAFSALTEEFEALRVL